MSNKIYFNRAELELIQQTLAQFPDVERFCLSNHIQTGIGSLTELMFDYEINGVRARVVIPVTDTTNW
jgi:hypothetical protein